jgi:hypothetical protein
MTILNINKIKPIVELSNKELIAKAKSVGTMVPFKETSDKYSFIPTLTAVNYLRDDGWLPTEAKETRSFKGERAGFQQHVIRFSKPELAVGDRRMELVMYNSHDGGSSFKLYGGIYRLVCSNGMVVGRDLMGFTHRHMSFELDQFMESARFIAGHMSKVGDKIEDWTRITLQEPERLEWAGTVLEHIYGEDPAPVFAPQLLECRRKQDVGNDLWNTFNVIQENITKGGLNGFRRDGKRFKTRPILDLKRDREINQSLWNMAEAMEDWKKAA